MNYLPFCGYWFYGSASSSEIASFYCSYGLLALAPTGGLSRIFGLIRCFASPRL